MIVAAQGLLLAGWAIVIALLIGWGALVRWAWREPLRADADDLLLAFWLGWAAVILTLQLWHFVLPVDERARVLVMAGGVIGLLSIWRVGWRMARQLHRALALVVVIAPPALWLANRATEGARFGDTGGYYVPAMRWVIEYPVVIGLANLYPPLAYNQTYFLYAALLDGGPFAGRPHHLLNSTLLFVLIVRTLIGLWRVLRRRGPVSAVDLFYALMLPAEADAATGHLLTSPAPDFAVFVLGIALCGELIALLTSPTTTNASDDVPRSAFHVPRSSQISQRGTHNAERETSDVRLPFLAVMLLATLAPTIKLSAAGLAGAAMLVATGVWIIRTRLTWRTTVGGLGVAAAGVALAIGPWVVGNVLMSGCPFFPSAIAALPVAWLVDWDVQQWIQNTMMVGDWRVAIRAPQWVAQRFVALGWTAPLVAVPCAIALAALVVGAVVRIVRLRRRTQGTALPVAAVFTPLASLVYCIATTPVPRYAGATMWLLAACSIMVALSDRMLAPIARRVTALIAVGLATLPFFTGTALWLNLRDFPPSPRPAVELQRLASGLEVYVPKPGTYSCWASTLPCTSRVHQGLRLRRPPDLAAGFEVDPAMRGHAIDAAPKP